MWVSMKRLLLKRQINGIKRGTAFLLVLFMVAVQVMDLPQAVFADSINRNKEVSYRVDQVYDKGSKSLTITVDADEESPDVAIDRMILPDGAAVNGDQAVYTVHNNGSYKFSVEYTVNSATATSSTANKVQTPSQANGKRKKRDIDIAVDTFPTVFAAGDVEINNGTFPDTEFQKYVNENFDRNKDGILSLAERNAVVEIYMRSTAITDMSGLHFFPDLSVLHISDTKALSSLDLSQNVALERLFLTDTEALSGLDLSQNVALQLLELVNTKALSSLDLSQNVVLQTLDLRSIELPSLDIGQNVALQKLYLENTETLPSLDLSQNQALRNLVIRGAVGQLANLDISQNSKLEVLSIDLDQGSILSSVDVSQNPELRRISLRGIPMDSLDVSKNPKLQSLSIFHEGFKSVDVSQNPDLEELNLHYGQLDNLNIRQNPKLVRLGVSGNNLTSLDVNQNPKLKHLDIGSNELTSLDLSQNPEIEILQVFKNKLTSLDVSQLPTLEYLRIEDNELTSLDVNKNGKLKTLNAWNNELTGLDVSKNPELMELNLSRNKLTSLDVSQNPELVYLRMSDNHLSNLDLSKNLKLELDWFALSPQTVEGEYKIKDSKYIVDFNDIVGSQNLNKIHVVYQGGNTIPYDPVTGIAIPPVNPNTESVTYSYDTGNKDEPYMNVRTISQGSYTIKATAGAGGSITPSGETVVKDGAAQEYIITPDNGYELDILLVDGVKVANGNQYTFRNIGANHTIEAIFKVIQIPPVKFTIRATVGAGGSITPSGETYVREGSTQEYIITPDSGYVIYAILVDGNVVTRSSTYRFEHVQKNHTIQVKFKKVTNGGGSGGGTTQDSNLPELPTESEVNLDMMVEPTEAIVEPIEMQPEEELPEKLPVQTAPEEQALTKQALIEEIPAEEVPKEAEMTEAIEELTSVEAVDNALKNPGVELQNPNLGRECNHLPLFILLILICGIGAILIKKERDITLQMEGK